MSNIHELVPTLVNLPRHEYADLILQVDAERRRTVEREAEQTRPHRGTSKDQFAVWMARQHLAIDKGIVKIAYLPGNAPADEVRLLEANALASLPENAPVEAVDFMPDIDGVSFSLYVADVTLRQFESVVNGQLKLPTGWSLEGVRIFSAGEL